MTAETSTPVITGCYNFRDAGDVPTLDGGRVRRGTLFRSDVPIRLTDADRVGLVNAGLRTVLDLRTGEEIVQYGVPVWGDNGPEHRHIELTAHELLPGAEEIATWSDPRAVGEYYVRILRNGDAAFAAVLDVLAEQGAWPTLVHCMSGRDRTAIVVALLLAIAGAADDDILADYARSDVGLRRLRDTLLRNANADLRHTVTNTDVMALTPPANLRVLIDEVRSRFGSWEGYVAHLGRTEQAAAIRRRLRAPDV